MTGIGGGDGKQENGKGGRGKKQDMSGEKTIGKSKGEIEKSV